MPFPSCWIVVLLVASTPLLATDQKDAAPLPAGANLLVNGGFEEWVDIKQVADPILRRDTVKHVTRIPADLWPRQWILFRVINQSGPAGSADIARDETVAHGGKYSLRFTNRSSKDITCAQYTTEYAVGASQLPPTIRANRHYRLSWWVKGAKVASGSGVRLDSLFQISNKDGKSQRVDIDVRDQDQSPAGTFDWERHDFSFTTDAGAQALNFCLELRSTTGTIWLDDVELKDCGPAATVQTY
jgi:hypothetical protein